MSKYLVAAAMVAGLGLQSAASGDLIVFDNPGMQFPWTYSVQLVSYQRGQGLDITKPSTQSGAPTPWTLIYNLPTIPTSNGWLESRIGTEGSSFGNVRLDGAGVLQPFTIPNGQVISVRAMRLYQIGQSVGPVGQWESQGTAAMRTLGATHPLLGTGGFIGVELTISGAVHYGWIQLAWGIAPGWSFEQYQPVIWAYEDSPGVPALVIPGPAAAVPLLALGAWAGARRRR